MQTSQCLKVIFARYEYTKIDILHITVSILIYMKILRVSDCCVVVISTLKKAVLAVCVEGIFDFRAHRRQGFSNAL